MSLPNPPGGLDVEEIVAQETELPPPSPLEIAKLDATRDGRMPRKRAEGPVLVAAPRGPKPKGHVYLRDSTRDRLAKVAFLMSVSFTEAITRLSTLSYTAGPRLLTLGVAPGEEIEARATRVSAEILPDAMDRLEQLARDLLLPPGVVRSRAAQALDMILDGRIALADGRTLEEAAESLRRNPLEQLAGGESGARLKMSLRVSTLALKGIVAIAIGFDRRYKSARLAKAAEMIAELPAEYVLTGDPIDAPRYPHPAKLPVWVVEKLARIGLDFMLIAKPSNRRPSVLTSEVLEYVGQGAIQIIHQKRSVDSLDILREAGLLR